MLFLIMVNPIMQTEINVLVRAANKPEITSDSALKVAMNQRKIQLKAFCGGLDCAKQDAEE